MAAVADNDHAAFLPPTMPMKKRISFAPMEPPQPATKDANHLEAAPEPPEAEECFSLPPKVPSCPETGRGRRRFRPKPLGAMDFATAPASPYDDDDDERSSSVPCRPSTCTGSKGPTLFHADGLSKPSWSPTSGSTRGSPQSPRSMPSTPAPSRDEFASIDGGVCVVFFDFDGTLTATPGERASTHGGKKADLCRRAAMLKPRLRELREAGATLGIISKSSENTIRDALQAADLAGCSFWGNRIIGNAVGFDGKVGFIEELAMQGLLPGLTGRRGFGIGPSRWTVVRGRILLVDDDVMELGRARHGGLQAYAAPEDGGLREEDFDVILDAVRSHQLIPQTPRVAHLVEMDEVMFSPTAGLLSPSAALVRDSTSSRRHWFDMFGWCSSQQTPKTACRFAERVESISLVTL
eukprot:TRINITY_DN123726_c0_g1_i1.p1 TRINITY_DN123726_c0_g1~~TRINITY_DN123726_c0_g1_i1.p1  ORF type:complete len:409 (+),score=83.78 TRINITY_DN123726_c0_g1_i1:162-1388(+)